MFQKPSGEDLETAHGVSMFRLPRQETPVQRADLVLETKQAQKSCFVSIVSSTTCFNTTDHGRLFGQKGDIL